MLALISPFNIAGETSELNITLVTFPLSYEFSPRCNCVMSFLKKSAMVENANTCFEDTVIKENFLD